MKVDFRDIRFSLFIKSYAGWYFANFIRQSEKQEVLTKRLAKVLLLNKKFLNCFVFHKTCQIKFSKIAAEIGKREERIKIYLLIEKELFTLAQEKKDKNNSASEDYEHALLEPAIERVAGNVIKNIENDSKFEKKHVELMKIYNHWYYAVAYRYRLPTLRIVPFILRLIQL